MQVWNAGAMLLVLHNMQAIIKKINEKLYEYLVDDEHVIKIMGCFACFLKQARHPQTLSIVNWLV